MNCKVLSTGVYYGCKYCYLSLWVPNSKNSMHIIWVSCIITFPLGFNMATVGHISHKEKEVPFIRRAAEAVPWGRTWRSSREELGYLPVYRRVLRRAGKLNIARRQIQYQTLVHIAIMRDRFFPWNSAVCTCTSNASKVVTAHAAHYARGVAFSFLPYRSNKQGLSPRPGGILKIRANLDPIYV